MTLNTCKQNVPFAVHLLPDRDHSGNADSAVSGRSCLFVTRPVPDTLVLCRPGRRVFQKYPAIQSSTAPRRIRQQLCIVTRRNCSGIARRTKADTENSCSGRNLYGWNTTGPPLPHATLNQKKPRITQIEIRIFICVHPWLIFTSVTRYKEMSSALFAVAAQALARARTRRCIQTVKTIKLKPSSASTNGKKNES